MKIYLTCPECGEKEWTRIESTLDVAFQCNHCKSIVQPEEMSSATEDNTNDKTPLQLTSAEPTKYFILEKYIPEENAWFFEACYDATDKGDLNAMVLAAYDLGCHKCCGEKGQCVRIVPSDSYVDCFCPPGYPKKQ